MNYILNRKIKYYTKEVIRLINLVAIALFIIMAIILLKYKLVCEVTLNGEVLGYIANKQEFEEIVNNEIINKQGNNIVSTIIKEIPEYKLTLLNNKEQTNEEEILAKINEISETTYKYYAVTLDGENKTIVENLEEAESLVSEMKEKYAESLELDIGIVEVYTIDQEEYKTVGIKTAKTEINKELEEKKEIAEHSLNGVYFSVTPVSGVITSRFGSRESIRDHVHAGIDIGAPGGTDIKAAADGTVTFSGYSGGYGYLVKISHGNGIDTYYAHCSALYVSEGEQVKAGDIIAAVGSTGNSTGNHLHFEIVVDGEEIDPQNYLYN